MTRVQAAILAFAISSCGNVFAADLELGLPIDCTVGQDCFVQQYTDMDPGRGAKDYACGGQTYDGHKGTDIRVKTLQEAKRGVDVIASAGGIVKGLRSSAVDRLVKTAADRARVKGRECGNGVLMAHPGGWETQYCHMKRGSVRVRKGDRVQAGDVLGQVGYSGEAAFAHVHLSVRKDGKVVDPFKGLTDGSVKCGVGAQPLWNKAALSALEYKAGQVLDAGFADHVVKLDELEDGRAQGFVPSRDSAAFGAWGWAINLRKGDRVVVVLKGPGGELVRSNKVLDSRKAQYFAFAGRKRPNGRWPPGRYVALFGVERGGETVMRAGRAFVLK